jgi:hypothetical protein
MTHGIKAGKVRTFTEYLAETKEGMINSTEFKRRKMKID